MTGGSDGGGKGLLLNVAGRGGGQGGGPVALVVESSGGGGIIDLLNEINSDEDDWVSLIARQDGSNGRDDGHKGKEGEGWD